MNKKISIVNQKGGVAKTTTAINLGASLAEEGKEVLLIDVDPQANLTQGIGSETNIDTTIYEILTEKLSLSDGIYKTKFEGLDVVPSHIRLANAEIELSGEINREAILAECFDKSPELNYDYILLDCNPSLGILTLNAMVASDELIIPMEPGMFSLDGIGHLIDVVKLVKKNLNQSLSIRGVLITRVDGRTNISSEFESELREVFGNKMFNTTIHQNVKIAEAQSEQLPINHYMKNARGAKEYRQLAKELIENE